MPLALSDAPNEIFSGRLHEFMTCRSISRRLGDDGAIDRSTSKFLEELSIKCVYRSLASDGLELWQVQLLLDDLPKLLPFEYDVVDGIKDACRQLLPQVMMQYRFNSDWRNYQRLNYIMQLLGG